MESGLPLVVNILLGQRGVHMPVSRMVASDFPVCGGRVRLPISEPANAKEAVVFQRDDVSDLRPPPRWGINE